MNYSSRKQCTIAKPVSVGGFGYWSGLDVRVEFHPAAVNAGISFVRTDLSGHPRIPVNVERRVDVPRRTNLQLGGVSVEMVEHVNAALAGLLIDNCEVRVDQAEMPGCDGSSLAFVEALQAAGRVSQRVDRQRCVISETIRVGDAESWIEARPSASECLEVTFHLDYSQAVVGEQTFHFVATEGAFERELASARTFILEAEADWMRSQGGGERVTYQDLIVFGDDGPLENELRYSDECVRHKTLDVIGDLALGGVDFIGHFEAYRSGHRLNAEIVQALLEARRNANGFRNAA